MAITFDIGFRLTGKDLSQQIGGQLEQVASEIDHAFQTAGASGGKMGQSISAAVQQANALKVALNEATTSKGLSFSLMQQSLAKSNTSAKQLLTTLAAGGPSFSKSFNIALTSLATANRQVITLSSRLAEAGRVFTQSLKFTTAQSVIRFLNSSMSSAIGWVKDLDSELAQIATVTGKTGSELDKVYKDIIQGAQDMRVAAKEYAEASLIFYQQGLNDGEVKRRTEITVQAAKAAGQSVETMASQLTAIWNSYKMVGEEQQRAAAVGAKLAASTAVDFSDIAEAMQISAAAAQQMGVDYNSLAAIIATVGDNTQQSASVIGNAFKTIFSRFEQLTTKGTDGEVTLGQVSTKLQSLGVNVMTANGQLRDLDTVINEVGSSWHTYSTEQQTAIAQLVGGTRQYGQFLTLMNSFPQYLNLTKVAAAETGETLVEQFIAARDTIEAAAENSKEAWNRALSSMFNADNMKDFYKNLEKIGNLVGDLIDTLGGIPGILMVIAAIFQKQIADKIVTTGIGIKSVVQNLTPTAQKNSVKKENAEEMASTKAVNNQMVKSGLLDSVDAKASEQKLRNAQQLKEIMIDVNRLTSSSDSLMRTHGEALSASLNNSTRAYQESIDKTAELTKGMRDAADQAKEIANKLQEVDNPMAFLNEEEKAILLTQREILDNSEKEIPIMEAKLELARQQAEAKKLEIDAKKEEENQKFNSTVGAQLNEARAQRDNPNLTPEQKRANEQQIVALKQQQAEHKKIIDIYNQQKDAQDKIVKAQEKVIDAAKRERDAAKGVVDELQKQSEANLNNQKGVANLEAEFLKVGERLGKGLLNGANTMGDVIKPLKQQIEQAFNDGLISKAIRDQLTEGLTLGPDQQANIQNLSNAIAQTLQGAQVAGVPINVDPKNFQLLAGNAQQAAQALRNMGIAGGEAEKNLNKTSMSGTDLVHSLVGVATSATMVVNGVNNLAKGIAEGDMTIGKFLSSLIMIVPSFISIISTIAKIPAVANSAAASNVVLQGSIMGVKVALDAATLGITAIISAIIVLIGVIAGWAQHEKKLREEEIKEAEEARKTADAMRDLTNTVQDSVSAYHEAADGISKLGRDTQDYADKAKSATEAAQQLIDALRNSDDLSFNGDEFADQIEKALNVAKYTGDWDALGDKIDEIQKKALKESVEANKKAGETSKIVLERSLKDNTTENYDASGMSYRAKTIGSGWSSGDEKEAEKAYNKISSDLSHISGDRYGLTIKTDGSLEDQIEAYKEALKLQKEMSQSMTAKEQEESEIYQNLTDWINESADAYKSYTEALQGSFEEQQQLLSLDPEAFAEAMSIDTSKIEGIDNIKDLIAPEGGFSTLEEYQNWREAIRQVGEQAGWTEEQIQQMINTNEETVGNNIAQDFVDEQVAAAGEAGEKVKTILEATYKDLKEQGLDKYFDNLVIDPTLDEKALQESIDKQLKKFQSLELQAKAEVNITDTSYAEKQKIADGLNVGDTISQEDFDKLGAGYEGFFKLMEDGTYQLIEDSELLANMIESQRQQTLLNDATSVAQDAQQYKGTDRELYNSMMETSAGSQQQLLASADSLRELNDLYATLKQAMADAGVDSVSYTAFSQALIGLASQFDNTADECEAYQLALRNGDKEQIAIAESALRAATIIGEGAEKYGLNAKSLEIQAQEMKNANKEMNLSDEQAAQMAVTNQRLNKGITTLSKNWENWSKQLKKADKTSQDFSDTAAELSDAVADIVGWYDELNLSSEFIEENFDLIEGAAKGEEKAILQLGNAVAQEAIANATLDKSLVSAYGPITSGQEVIKGTASAFEELWSKQEKWISSADMFAQVQTNVASGFDLISQNMDALLSGDKSLSDILGGEEGLADFVENLNAYAAATGMTAQEMQQMLSSVGVTANVTTDYVQQDVEVPTYSEQSVNDGYDTFTWTGEDGVEHTTTRPRIRKFTIPQKPMTVKGYVGVAKIDMQGADGSGSGVPDIQFTGKSKPSTTAINGGNSGGGSKGGGGSKSEPKKASRVSKTENVELERYTDNKNAIEDVTRAVDRLNKANDHAFGPQKIRNLNLINNQLAKQAARYRALYQEAKTYQKIDAAAIDAGLARFNAAYGTTLKAEYDGDNLLDNQMEIMNVVASVQQAIVDEINTVKNALNDLVDEGRLEDDPAVVEKTTKIKELEEKLSRTQDDIKDMIGDNLEKYQTAIQEMNDALEAMVDILHQGLQNEIDKYTIARDLHLKINDLEQRHWEAIMDTMGNVGKLGKQVAGMLKSSLESINDSVQRYITHYGQMEEVQKRWENRDITLKSEYAIDDKVWDMALQSGKIPQEIMDEFEGDVDALMDLRKQVWDNLDKQWQNYIDSIQYYIDEYDRITDKLDKQASIADNLMNVIETVGFNYKWGADESKAMFKNMSAQLDIVKNKAAAVNGELAIATNRRKEAEEELKKLMGGKNAFEFANSANEAEMFEYNRIKEHYDEMASLEAELNAERISLLNEAYEKATEYAQRWGEIIAHEADEALNGAFDKLDEAMDMYNQKRDIDTFFMDDVDKAFELNKLKREVEDVIEDISDPEQLERYNKLIAEIEQRKADGVKMTEKDLEILRAQFDLEKARDAYQDARNAKNTMRLTRDASGNYTYVYSAEEGSIEDQEAKVEEAMHNIYKLNRDAADEYAEAWLQLQVDWENYYQSIDQARYQQDVKYRDMVDQRMKWYAEQSDLLSNEIIKHNDAIDRSFTDMTLSVITNTTNMDDTNTMYKEHHTELKEKLVENYQEWIEKADETMREVGGSMSDLETVVDQETDQMMTEVNNLREEIDRLNVEAQSALSDMAGFIGSWAATVNNEFESVIQEIDRLIEKYLEMLRVMAQQADVEASNNNYYDKSTDYSALGANLYKDAQKNGFTGDYESFLRTNSWIVQQTYNAQMDDSRRGQYYHGDNPSYSYEDALNHLLGAQGTNRTDHNFKGESNITSSGNGNIIITGDGTYNILTGEKVGKTASGGLVKTQQVRSLAEEGPELVLNAADTQNILNAVQAVRGIVQAQMGSVEIGLRGKTAAMSDLGTPPPTDTTQPIDQTVHIDATFPGVTAAAEIETALNNLIVQAAHYTLNNK